MKVSKVVYRKQIKKTLMRATSSKLLKTTNKGTVAKISRLPYFFIKSETSSDEYFKY